MESRSSLLALTPLISRRFQSFSEAADAALASVAGTVGGTIVLGQAGDDGVSWRLRDVRGAPRPGLEPGTIVPRGPIDQFSPEFLRSRQVGGSISLPLELSDGKIVGIVAALDDEDSYGADDLVVVSLAARVLAYEWERVRIRTELREVRQQLADGGGVDPETGLADRAGFIELLGREWRLAKRGTVRSMVVVCEVGLEDRPDGSALVQLALRDAAEVLSGAARSTDHVGRIAATRLASVLVGCEDIAGVERMLARLTESLRRVTSSRPYEIRLICGTFNLEAGESAADALERAEGSLGNVAPAVAEVHGG